MPAIFFYIKNELHQTGYFVARDTKWQPITCEIHYYYLFFFLKNEPFHFAVSIDRCIRFDFLIKRYNFVACKIVDIQLPKGKKLTKDQKLMLSKMVF